MRFRASASQIAPHPRIYFTRPWISAARAIPPRAARTCSPYPIGILLLFHLPACITELKSTFNADRSCAAPTRAEWPDSCSRSFFSNPIHCPTFRQTVDTTCAVEGPPTSDESTMMLSFKISVVSRRLRRAPLGRTKSSSRSRRTTAAAPSRPRPQRASAGVALTDVGAFDLGRARAYISQAIVLYRPQRS